MSGLEIRSIDYVPLDERHGKLWHLGPLWFMSNAQIATLAVGLISITEGGNLVWSLIAIVAGTVLGTFFMAFHSAQGPQLGLPQMIQSRRPRLVGVRSADGRRRAEQGFGRPCSPEMSLVRRWTRNGLQRRRAVVALARRGAGLGSSPPAAS
ncbi:cytosine permease [Streptomyces sp. NBC_00474]|uniref:cytosine permease n=1 Tax=Streptomyces sp. NBC_00474 TaxID=2975754 RepID=UPI00225A1EF7|nr:cytosine permease [Streptomyces sp. NBC_00474]MCX5053159.1 cytosine permease [Streptomyces sp. NBC_00474]